jgi:Tfp pilus assembly major pilin PilA
MPRSSLVLIVVSVVFLVLGYSLVNWGWPPVGSEAAERFGVACVVASVIFIVFAAILFFLRHRVSEVRFRRPLSNIPRILVGLPILVLILTFWVREPCTASPFYFETVLATFIVCVVMWSNHLRLAPIHHWQSVAKVVLSSVYDLILLIFLFILISIPVAVITPAYQCYTPRAKVSELIMSASLARQEIENRAKKTNSLQGVGIGLQIAPDRRAKAGAVTNDGIIVAVSEDPPAVVILSPTLDRGTISWKCLGFPTKYMPQPCRE